ncbi:hypothetical protein H1Z61_17105 [Bacillus aquiflavi]|uniref:Uncharacterized protein n=1 Tax=Bacillus aquiflavi TaxID=2672567 RepID=A0A6B3W3S7_9BACI|nr:hypothetical protein [Bacillus aquiflavi]MBA4538797.1 hypothetical protein [Bacillus aquiflavi]NEY83147.1 hypothetical protein [Bacillus aquiflavi]UAC49335.1 hypothetical protein K6959_05635 [Bacillus aquiflavi]
MSFEGKLFKLLNDNNLNKDEKLKSLGTIGDILEYGNISRDEAIEEMNILIKHLVQQDDNDIKEAILSIILNAEDTRSIDKELDLDPIVSNLKKFNDECISYILSMLGYSGKEKYRSTIEQFKKNPRLEEDVEDALLELDFRIKNQN